MVLDTGAPCQSMGYVDASTCLFVPASAHLSYAVADMPVLLVCVPASQVLVSHPELGTTVVQVKPPAH
jgi:hypothetical protein